MRTEQDEKNKIGLSENLTKQKVVEWIKQNLSDSNQCRFNLRLTQLDDGNYTIEIKEIHK